MVYSIDTLVYSYVCLYRLPTCLQGCSQGFSRGTHNFLNPPLLSPFPSSLKSSFFQLQSRKYSAGLSLQPQSYKSSFFLPSKVRSERPNLKFLSALTICLCTCSIDSVIYVQYILVSFLFKIVLFSPFSGTHVRTDSYAPGLFFTY